MSKKSPITDMFLEMIKGGHIAPVKYMEDLRLPGEYVSVPSVLTYDTPSLREMTGETGDAELGQRSQRNIRT